MRPEILLDHFHSFFFWKILWRLICKLRISVVIDVVVESTVMINGYLCDGFVKDDIGLVVNTHDFSLKYTIIFSDYFCSFPYILIPEDLLSLGGVHI